MTQYKSIAGPIGLTAESGQDYETAVKKYAAIIDENAVGGWELLWIQQIPVTKLKVNISGVIGVTVIGCAIGGAIWGAIVVAMAGYRELMGGIISGAFVGGAIGAAIGYAACKDKVVEFFNMLIFSKKN
jgi:hypothetical protein